MIFKHIEGQLARWLEELAQYDMEIVHRSGKMLLPLLASLTGYGVGSFIDNGTTSSTSNSIYPTGYGLSDRNYNYHKEVELDSIQHDSSRSPASYLVYGLVRRLSGASCSLSQTI
jgi:hypothetical protein